MLLFSFQPIKFLILDMILFLSKQKTLLTKAIFSSMSAYFPGSFNFST